MTFTAYFLRGMHTLGRFSISYKEDNFCDFLFVFLHTNLFWKEVLL